MKNFEEDAMRNHLIFATACLVLAVTGCSKPAVPASAPSPLVDVTPVVQKDVPITKEWVVKIDGFVNAQIQSQASGYLPGKPIKRFRS
jgi:hypothetical protein